MPRPAKEEAHAPDAPAAEILIGTQGWNYDAWVGPFYPAGTRAGEFLKLYARAFRTVEVDSTFYAIPPARTVEGWASRTSPDFIFALKIPQEITHARKLVECEEPLTLFLERARLLGPRLGPLLFQFAPDFAPVALPALAAFLPLLPRDLRFAIEFRQRHWVTDDVLALLAEHHVALALTDGRWIPRRTMLELAERPTADFAYIRWMGPNRDVVDYSRIQHDRTRELEQWSAAVKGMARRVRTMYGYVNNHFAGHSPASARQLQEMLGQRTVDPRDLGDQISMF
jgi:uncharacterized protein YecE (DUF72 family)